VQEVLALMKEPGTLDELGFGRLRDAYADTLFPGFTTIQTRARYFLAVPKIMLDWAELTDSKRRRQPLDEYLKIKENELARTLKSNHDAVGLSLEGVIGHTMTETGGVTRRPSSTYWNGLRVFGIVRTERSLTEFCRYWRREGSSEKAVSSDEGSDDAEQRFDSIIHKKLPGSRGEWPAGLTLKLNLDEASFLRERFIAAHGLANTVCAQLLSHQGLTIDALNDGYTDFSAFSAWATKQHVLSQQCRDNIEAAQRFSLVVRGAHIVFNRLMAEITNDAGLKSRCGKRYEGWRATARLEGIFHPNAHHEWLKVAEGRSAGMGRTADFLARWNELNLAHEPQESEIDALVRKQALDNKAARSLLTKLPAEQSDWYGMDALDYRWQTVRRILKDIVEALPC
jgi:hypothetical protein